MFVIAKETNTTVYELFLTPGGMGDESKNACQ